MIILLFIMDLISEGDQFKLFILGDLARDIYGPVGTSTQVIPLAGLYGDVPLIHLGDLPLLPVLRDFPVGLNSLPKNFTNTPIST